MTRGGRVPVELTATGRATWLWKARFADLAAGSFTRRGPERPRGRPRDPNAGAKSCSAHATARKPTCWPWRIRNCWRPGHITVSVANTRLNDLAKPFLQLLHYPSRLRRAGRFQPVALDRVARRPDAASAAPTGTNDVEARNPGGCGSPLLDAHAQAGWAIGRARGKPMLLGERLRGHGARAGPAPRRRTLLGFRVPVPNYLEQQLRSVTADDSDTGPTVAGRYVSLRSASPGPYSCAAQSPERGGQGDSGRAIAESQGRSNDRGLARPPSRSQRRRSAVRLSGARTDAYYDCWPDSLPTRRPGR